MHFNTSPLFIQYKDCTGTVIVSQFDGNCILSVNVIKIKAFQDSLQLVTRSSIIIRLEAVICDLQWQRCDLSEVKL